MRRCHAILLLGLALLTEPAGARTYKLTVSTHPAVTPPLYQDEVEGILKKASTILQRCKVKFKFNGFKPFPTSAPADITNKFDLETVHRVPADIKVVRSISFCVGEREKNEFEGCSWRPEGRPKTVIVTRWGSSLGDGIGQVLWAHEFGHTTGLVHRYQQSNLNLMTPCELQAFSQQVNQDECDHFRVGPVSHYPPGLGDPCQTSN